MSTNITPTPAPEPSENPSAPFTTIDGANAAAYIESELTRARKGLMTTRIVSAVLVLSALFECIYVTGNLTKYLEPKAAADVVQGEVSQRLDDQSDNLRDAMAQRIPVLISQVPDQVIGQMPSFRESLEKKFNDDLSTYADDSSKNLDAQMSDYLAAHKDEVKTALTDQNNVGAIHELGAGLSSQFMESLKTTTDGGETLQAKMDDSLTDLKSIKSKLDHLANDKNLSPDDKRTRHMIALLVHSANLHAPAIDVKQSVANAQNTVANAVQTQ